MPFILLFVQIIRFSVYRQRCALAGYRFGGLVTVSVYTKRNPFIQKEPVCAGSFQCYKELAIPD